MRTGSSLASASFDFLFVSFLFPGNYATKTHVAGRLRGAAAQGRPPRVPGLQPSVGPSAAVVWRGARVGP